ncbi:hypothetical protein DM860_011600 [Cuscuta australis]|uniref:Uncharacterized protein n=1 Tax=Cuscuta australis TaxID=267555 RepID=A0A328D0U4_9ASTE|nr:hypothetical protein DM860_011600 [Cuscuta australis]
MSKIIKDTVGPKNIKDGSLELEEEEFCLGSVVHAIVSQVMVLMKERGLQLIDDIPERIKTLAVYGDQVRIQQVLSEFLLNMVHHPPLSKGWVIGCKSYHQIVFNKVLAITSTSLGF